MNTLPADDNRVQPLARAIRPAKTPVAPDVDADELFDLRRKDSLKFVFQILLTATIVVLCATQLVTKEDSPDKAIYWSGITSTLAWWMPSPGNSKGSKSEP